jgi:hypothetical protein
VAKMDWEKARRASQASRTGDPTRFDMKARYPGTCRARQGIIRAGDTIYWFPQTKAVEHDNCTRRRRTTPGR